MRLLFGGHWRFFAVWDSAQSSLGNICQPLKILLSNLVRIPLSTAAGALACSSQQRSLVGVDRVPDSRFGVAVAGSWVS